MDGEELEALEPLHYSHVDVCSDPPFPVVRDQLHYLAHVEGEFVSLNVPVGEITHKSKY